MTRCGHSGLTVLDCYQRETILTSSVLDAARGPALHGSLPPKSTFPPEPWRGEVLFAVGEVLTILQWAVEDVAGAFVHRLEGAREWTMHSRRALLAGR